MLEMSLLDQEHLRLLLLDTKNRVLEMPTVYIGNLNTSVIRVGELFRYAVRANCAGMIVVHNHPSGEPEPTEDDIKVTKHLIRTCELVGVRVLDHIIIGGDNHTSFVDMGLIKE